MLFFYKTSMGYRHTNTEGSHIIIINHLPLHINREWFISFVHPFRSLHLSSVITPSFFIPLLTKSLSGPLPFPLHSTYYLWQTSKNVKCLAIIPDYNFNIEETSKKWWHKLFFGLLDVALVNSYVIYKKINTE